MNRRKFLGQHYLKDKKCAELIVQAALESAKKEGCKSVLEIGPGTGALTFPLIEGLKHHGSGIEHFILSEIDKKHFQFWKNHFLAHPLSGAHVLEGDFLNLNKSEWLMTPPLAVVSNLPYSVGTTIMTQLARYYNEIPVMVFMFQEEVAKRIRAVPNTKSWGSLSLWIQNWWEVQKLMSVSGRAFSPPPKVNSEVLILKARREPLIVGSENMAHLMLWGQLLKVSFSYRRKMLRSSLPQSGAWKAALKDANVEDTKRVGELAWEDWKRFYESILRFSQSPSK